MAYFFIVKDYNNTILSFCAIFCVWRMRELLKFAKKSIFFEKILKNFQNYLYKANYLWYNVCG